MNTKVFDIAINFTRSLVTLGFILFSTIALIGCSSGDGNGGLSDSSQCDIPFEANVTRTWVERYFVPTPDPRHPEREPHPVVDSPNGGYDGFGDSAHQGERGRSFFVPKLCNHCTHSPSIGARRTENAFTNTVHTVAILKPSDIVG